VRSSYHRAASPSQQHAPPTKPLTASRAASVNDWIAENMGSPVAKGGDVGGGSGWSSATIYTTQDGQQYFVKTARGKEAFSMFQGEALGLQAMYGK